MNLCLVPVAGASFCIHKKEPGGPQQILGRVLDRLFMEESERLQEKLELRHAAEHCTLLHLAESTRAAAMRRRDLWHGTTLYARNRWAWLPATLRYLYLRMRLVLAQSSMERKLRDEIRQLT
jgi:hypothetical protein